jgi:transposase
MADINPLSYTHEGPDAAGPALAEARQTARAMVAEGRAEEAFEFLLSALAAVLRKSRELELLVARLRRVGRSSERMDPGQLALLFEGLIDQLGGEVETLDPEAEAREDADLAEEIQQERERRKQHGAGQREPGRNWRTAGVARQVHNVAVGTEQRTCERCGLEKNNIGTDVSRILEYVPGHFVEHEYHREKWACGRCKRGVTTAPAPAKVIERGAADASLLAHVVVSKYVDHCPLHRLNRVYDRSGATIPVSTLADWVGQVADRVSPLVDRIARRILHDAYVVRTDATGLKVLDPSSPERIQRGTIWALVGDDRDVVFRYTPTGEGATGPWTLLAGRQGYLQADAANVFDRLYNGNVASAVEVGCWAHARRKFVALQDTDFRVAYPIKLIGRLYRIEQLADLRELSAEERQALRLQRSRPTLDKLQRWLLGVVAHEPPSSEFARASAYALNHWSALTRFLDDGRLSLDNNLCERQLRDIALGRKNFLFAGSHEAAHRTAALYSLLRTCQQYGVPPQDYLTDVLRTIARGWPHHRLDELLPDRWQPPERAPP